QILTLLRHNWLPADRLPWSPDSPAYFRFRHPFQRRCFSYPYTEHSDSLSVYLLSFQGLLSALYSAGLHWLPPLGHPPYPALRSPCRSTVARPQAPVQHLALHDREGWH